MYSKLDWTLNPCLALSLIDYALHEILSEDPKEIVLIGKKICKNYYDAGLLTLY